MLRSSEPRSWGSHPSGHANSPTDIRLAPGHFMGRLFCSGLAILLPVCWKVTVEFLDIFPFLVGSHAGIRLVVSFAYAPSWSSLSASTRKNSIHFLQLSPGEHHLIRLPRGLRIPSTCLTRCNSFTALGHSRQSARREAGGRF